MNKLQSHEEKVLEEIFNTFGEGKLSTGYHLPLENYDELISIVKTALSTQREIIIEMIDKELESEHELLLIQEKNMVESYEVDKKRYERTGLHSDYKKVKFNEGTTASYSAGVLVGKKLAYSKQRQKLTALKGEK